MRIVNAIYVAFPIPLPSYIYASTKQYTKAVLVKLL